MKIIKLDRRFKANRKHGITVALKFDRYLGAGQYFDGLVRTTWQHDWDDIDNWPWMDWFSDKKTKPFRTYYIGFTEPGTLTMLMLRADPKRYQDTDG